MKPESHISKVLLGVTFVPESQVNYYRDRGIEPYELIPPFRKRGLEKGVIVSDSVELLEQFWNLFPFNKWSPSVAVFGVRFSRDMVLYEKQLKDTETERFVHFWVLSEVKSYQIEIVEGVIFSPPRGHQNN